MTEADNYIMFEEWGDLKIMCSTCGVITMGKKCFKNIYERLNSLKIKCWYTTQLFISTEQIT